MMRRAAQDPSFMIVQTASQNAAAALERKIVLVGLKPDILILNQEDLSVDFALFPGISGDYALTPVPSVQTKIFGPGICPIASLALLRLQKIKSLFGIRKICVDWTGYPK